MLTPLPGCLHLLPRLLSFPRATEGLPPCPAPAADEFPPPLNVLVILYILRWIKDEKASSSDPDPSLTSSAGFLQPRGPCIILELRLLSEMSLIESDDLSRFGSPSILFFSGVIGHVLGHKSCSLEIK